MRVNMYAPFVGLRVKGTRRWRDGKVFLPLDSTTLRRVEA
jgi:hypothetical protein